MITDTIIPMLIKVLIPPTVLRMLMKFEMQSLFTNMYPSSNYHIDNLLQV
jgi:hypothetical protein